MAEPHHEPQEQTHTEGPVRECQGCPRAHACRDAWSAKNTGPLAPVGLTLGSALAFLFPLITAIGAGALAKHYWTGGQTPRPGLEALAALGGLVGGVFIAWGIMPRIKQHFASDAEARS